MAVLPEPNSVDHGASIFFHPSTNRGGSPGTYNPVATAHADAMKMQNQTTPTHAASPSPTEKADQSSYTSIYDQIRQSLK